jgi:hypothetical protein
MYANSISERYPNFKMKKEGEIKYKNNNNCRGLRGHSIQWLGGG